MKGKFGNSFHTSVSDVALSVENVWLQTEQFLPKGACVPCDATYTEGKRFPAGTPVDFDASGKVLLGSAATNPVGLTYEDVVVGSQGGSVTIVVRGTINESLSNATVTAAQKSKLPQIIFVTE